MLPEDSQERKEGKIHYFQMQAMNTLTQWENGGNSHYWWMWWHSPIWSMTQEQNIQLHHQHILKKRTSMFQLKRGMIYVKAGLEVLNLSRKNEFKSTYMLASDIELIKATLKM